MFLDAWRFWLMFANVYAFSPLQLIIARFSSMSLDNLKLEGSWGKGAALFRGTRCFSMLMMVVMVIIIVTRCIKSPMFYSN